MISRRFARAYVGVRSNARNRRKARAKVIAEAAALARDFGIVIRDERVYYCQHTRVWFAQPDDRRGQHAVGERKKRGPFTVGSGQLAVGERSPCSRGSKSMLLEHGRRLNAPTSQKRSLRALRSAHLSVGRGSPRPV